MFSRMSPRTRERPTTDPAVNLGSPSPHAAHGRQPMGITPLSVPHGPGQNRVEIGGARAPVDYDRTQPSLICVDLNVLAVNLKPRRDGRGHFFVFLLAHSAYQEAVCYSEKLPFAVVAGQKVRIVGRRGEYRGKLQIIFQVRDIQLVSEPADNVDLVAIDATVGRVSVQSPDRAWKAFRISCGGFEGAAGDIGFDIHDGQRLRLRGFKGSYMGKPQLLVIHAEPLGVEYADDRRRIFAQNKIPPRYFDCLVAAFGSDFGTRVSGEPALITSVLPKIKPAMCAKIADACVRIEAQDAFSAALRRCSVPEPTVAAVIAKHPDGLARLTAYDLIDYSFLDEDRTRGPRRGLTGNEADKLPVMASLSELMEVRSKLKMV
jgi:hypothetical protein